jgi:xanthine dehydrogenase small subunit
MKPDTPSKTLSFLHRGQALRLGNVPPDRTLLEVLRDDLGLTATKEGCGEGDCGACTVVLTELVDGVPVHKAINSCIRLAHSVQGMAVTTAADMASPQGDLHPAQEAMVRCHGSQCGFCTPGFVSSLWALYQNTQRGQGVTRDSAQAALSGNLCRCTGYRPILDAACHMKEVPLPAGCAVDDQATVTALQALALESAPTDAAYLRPRSLSALLQARAQHPKAQLVAGCTDVGLWITKGHRRFDRIIDLSATADLQAVEHYPHHIAIGAAVTLSDAFEALLEERPQLRTFTERFAGLPVRNSGTLGGNVANGSPIGDSMPLLIALGASVVLMRHTGGPSGGKLTHRELALEDLYTGYRQNVMRPDEVLAWIKVPRPTPDERLKIYKVSKRRDDDISAVCLALRLSVVDGAIVGASVGVGGVAATPVRARQTEQALVGQPFNEASLDHAGQVLASEFTPLSDMRASAAYRRALLHKLMQRAALEWSGMALPRMDELKAADLETLA